MRGYIVTLSSDNFEETINMVFSLLFPFVCLFLTIGFFERYSNINFYTRIIIQLGFSFSPLYCRNDYPIICQVFNLVPREIVSYELLIIRSGREVKSRQRSIE